MSLNRIEQSTKFTPRRPQSWSQDLGHTTGRTEQTRKANRSIHKAKYLQWRNGACLVLPCHITDKEMPVRGATTWWIHRQRGWPARPA